MLLSSDSHQTLINPVTCHPPLPRHPLPSSEPFVYNFMSFLFIVMVVCAHLVYFCERGVNKQFPASYLEGIHLHARTPLRRPDQNPL